MRKVICVLLAILVCVSVGLSVNVLWSIKYNALVRYNDVRIVDAIVCAVDDDVVTLVDGDGNLWDIEGDGYSVNDAVVMAMSNCGTADLTDDVILCVR